jgi:hypothetical protein
MSTRNAIERMFGVWKRTFLVLHSEVSFEITNMTLLVIGKLVDKQGP